MKALSIRQPWAWSIAAGHKGVENRSWNTKFRGEFLIHAGGKFDRDGLEFVQGRCTPPTGFDMGGFVGIAELIHVVHENDRQHLTARDKPWFFGPYGFILENARPIPFIPYKGQLGFFNVPSLEELQNVK